MRISLVFLVLLLHRCELVFPQDVVESSGEAIVSSQPALDFASSGDGILLSGQDSILDVTSGVVYLGTSDDNVTVSTERDDNSTNIDELGNATTTLPTTTSTVPPTTTTTEQPTTLSTTSTSVPTTSTTTEATTTTTTEATTTTTTRRTTTTTRPPTTQTTTFRTTTTTKRTTEAPIPSDNPLMEVPCEFLEVDFACDFDISCFGEGTVDCVDVGEDSPDFPDSSEAHVEEPEEYEEVSATIGLDPPDNKQNLENKLFPLWNLQGFTENLTTFALTDNDEESPRTTTTAILQAMTRPATTPTTESPRTTTTTTTQALTKAATTTTTPSETTITTTSPARTTTEPISSTTLSGDFSEVESSRGVVDHCRD